MTRRAVSVPGTLITALVLATTAAIPSAEATPADATTSPVKHCVLDMGSGEQSCHRTFTGAIEAASGGEIADAPASASAAVGDGAFRADLRSLKADDVIQGTFFEDEQYRGSSLTIRGSGPCEKDGWVDYQYDLPDEWKNRISSVQPWAECWLWLYPEPGLGGDRDGPFKENSPAIGSVMNDRTQSIGFS
ncbi:hypothetical protein [Streptomyces sp. MW-W600-10]|uniref:hypothetical protein n=1 Tax=Streptomyces sp. MW-W600-10 TaxID=2829819 RepID=UPI00210B9643|nr:hypothetical protein [Streptomyces sp. MW-W600-10]